MKKQVVIEVDEGSFQREVLDRSRQVPVVVDYWAEWCGPCRMLGPVLERLAHESGGSWVLAKLNTDENQRLAAGHQIQGIPAVKAFRDGKVVDEFVGALPEPAVRDWLRGILRSQVAPLVRKALDQEARGELAAAEAGYRAAIADEPGHAGALVGLGRVLVESDRYADAIQVLGKVRWDALERSEAEGWLNMARFRQEAQLTGGEVEARRKLAANPDDPAARLALAGTLAAKGSYREAIEGLLALMQSSSGETQERARREILAIFGILGDEAELTKEYRPRLAALLW